MLLRDHTTTKARRFRRAFVVSEKPMVNEALATI
jgi:hypothetical protein